ncbi:MAG TPA: tetratricopeptide repeat protein [Ignavibacteriaceae bacterium]|nr:tetratricopeptide repeat protein [Ignavibacteriaceae bacterium]
MKLISIPVIILLFTPVLLSQQYIERQISSGLDACYNFNWEQSDQIFQNLIEKYPDDPRGYQFKSSIYLWYYLGGKDKDNLDEFENYSDLALKKGEAITDKDENNEMALYCLGACYNYRAIAFGKAGNFLDAAWATKKSESYLSKVLELNPHRYDAYLGLGLYNFAVAQIPSAFKWALNLVGISGNKETGVKYIEMAAENGNYAKVEAQYYLAQINMDFLIDYESSAAILKRLVKRYPKNILFIYSYAVLQMRQRNLSQAEILLDRVIKANDRRFNQITSFSYFLKGDINFRNNKPDSAKTYYLHFLNEAEDNDYTGIASYRIAICYEVTGDREEAVKYFQKAQTGNMDLDDDIYAKRKGEIYAGRSLSSSELNLIFDYNLIEAGKYKAAYDSITSLLPSIQAPKIRAEALLYKSDAAYYMGNYQESIELAEQALDGDQSNEKWIIPYCYYNIARANKKIGNLEEVKLNSEKAEEENNYDYQNKLKNLLYPLQEDSIKIK